MPRQPGQPHAQQVAEHGHVNGEAAQTVGEVALRQQTLDQVDHDLNGGRFIAVDHLEDESSQDVQTLAIADWLIPTSVTEEHATQHRLVVPAGGAAEEAASGSVQVLWICQSLLVVVLSYSTSLLWLDSEFLVVSYRIINTH